MLKILLVLLLVATAHAVVYERCAWARILNNHRMGGYRGYSLADWVCLTQWESKFNTAAINHNRDGSTDYGIFQINNRWWCDDGQFRTYNKCNVKCNELQTNNVAKAINCAKRVVQDRNGMAAWYAWRSHCQNQDLTSYLEGCGL